MCIRLEEMKARALGTPGTNVQQSLGNSRLPEAASAAVPLRSVLNPYCYSKYSYSCMDCMQIANKS